MGYSTLRKYAVTLDTSTAGSRTLTFLPTKASTGNTFATSSDWTPAAADFKVAKAVTGSGLGSEASIGTAPTWVNGRVVIILSGTELTCRYLTIRIENAAIVSDEIIVETYGNASAQYPTVYSGGSAGNLITSGTGADQLQVSSGAATTDAYTRLGAPAGASVSADIAAVATDAANASSRAQSAGDTASAIQAVTDQFVFTNAGAVDATTLNKTGYSLSSSQTFNMTGNITGNLSGSVGSVTGAVASVTGNVGGNVTGSVASVAAGVSIATGGIVAGSIATSALNGKGDWVLSSSYTAPPTAVAIRSEIDSNSTKLANLSASATNTANIGSTNIASVSNSLAAMISANKFTTSALSNGPTGSGSSGGGTGSGTNPIDHSGGDGVTVDSAASSTDILQYLKSDSSGADGLFVSAYLASEYDASPPVRTAKAVTRTGPDGRWLAPLMLDSGTYYIVADAAGDGYQAKINTVVVP